MEKAQTKEIFGVTINTYRELCDEAYEDPEFLAQQYDPQVEAWDNLPIEKKLKRIDKVHEALRPFFQEIDKKFFAEFMADRNKNTPT